ncbi:MAG: MBL fold metallo-hydrolase [Chloroflexi bacterium]|nr:MBL fold metallo-hydrolase [Chloroflexota bacterium]
MNLGTTTINVVSDGTILIDGGSLFGQVPKSQWETQIKPDRRNRIRLALNCMLVQTPKMNILVDTGAGSKRLDKFKEAYGLNGNKLLKGLRALGLTARDIDVVVLSNLQFDHCGGCTKLDRSGNAVPTFPKAKYLIQTSSWEEANNPNERFKHAFYSDDFLPLHEKGLVEFVDGDFEVIPGLNVKVTNGPSAGHQIVLVERGSEKVAYVSDLIPTPHHLPLPYIPARDQNPNETLAQKKDFLKMAVEGGWLVIFGHGNDHKAGYVQKRNGSSHLLPVEV